MQVPIKVCEGEWSWTGLVQFSYRYINWQTRHWFIFKSLITVLYLQAWGIMFLHIFCFRRWDLICNIEDLTLNWKGNFEYWLVMSSSPTNRVEAWLGKEMCKTKHVAVDLFPPIYMFYVVWYSKARLDIMNWIFNWISLFLAFPNYFISSLIIYM